MSDPLAPTFFSRSEKITHQEISLTDRIKEEDKTDTRRRQPSKLEHGAELRDREAGIGVNARTERRGRTKKKRKERKRWCTGNNREKKGGRNISR